MLADSPALSGFSVDDPVAARRFNEQTLGLRVSVVEMEGLMRLALGGAGIMREGSPLIAWSTDPAGNVFSVIQQA